jgi:CheY-like chemotaxis protein
MTLSSLLVCADDASVQVLHRVMEELGIKLELCADVARAAVRLAQERFDLIILDCEKQADMTSLLHEARTSRLNDTSLAVVVVGGQENIREIFSLGVNFVLYKPVSYDRALSSLRASQNLLYRDKRRKARATVHMRPLITPAENRPKPRSSIWRKMAWQ